MIPDIPNNSLKRLSRRTIPCVVLAALLMSATSAISEPLLLNFRNTDIRQIIESVGELTGKNFLIDPRVKGKVTILANEAVPEEALYDVMLSILRMHGFRAVEGGDNLTRILPGNIAARFKPEFVEGDPRGESEKLITTIIQIRHLNAATIIPMIKPLMTPEAQVLVHKETNNLLVTEVNSNLERVRRVIDKIDVKDVGDFEIVSLDYADAKDLVGLLQRASNKNLRHLVQVVADKQGNRIILTGPPSARRSLRALIAELDSETSSDTSGLIKVIRLHYARAEDVEKIIKGLLSSSEFLKTLGGEGEYAEPRKTPVKKDAKKKDAKKKDTKADKTTEKKKTTGASKRNHVIQVDKALNALIVGGPPRLIAAVERVVREIDVPRPQVLIEAIFADTLQEKAFDLGTRLRGGKVIRAEADEKEVRDSRGGVVQRQEDVVRGVGAVFMGIDPRDSNFGLFGQASFSGNLINFLITAFRTDQDTRVLSTPSILTLNNEEATIEVAEVLSNRTGRVTDSGGSNIAFERQEFGTKLKVRPQITEGDSVRLDIEYKTEEVLPTSRGDSGALDSRNREIKTTVLVNDGDILVLGGLSNESASESEGRVPVLSKVPVLGHLFRGRESNRTQTTLMVFIRPTILRNADEGSETSRERYAALRFNQLMDAQATETLLPDEDQMVLPTLRRPDAEDGRKLKRKKKIIKRKKRRRSDG